MLNSISNIQNFIQENLNAIIFLLFILYFVVLTFLYCINNCISKIKMGFIYLSLALCSLIILLIMFKANHFSCYLFVSIILIYPLLSDDIKNEIKDFLRAYNGSTGKIKDATNQEILLNKIKTKLDDIFLYFEIEETSKNGTPFSKKQSEVEKEEQGERKEKNKKSEQKQKANPCIKTDKPWAKYLREGLFDIKQQDKNLYFNSSENFYYEQNKQIVVNNHVLYPDGILRKKNKDYLLEVIVVDRYNNEFLYSKIREILYRDLIFYKNYLPQRNVHILIKVVISEMNEDLENMLKELIKDVLTKIDNKQYYINYETLIDE